MEEEGDGGEDEDDEEADEEDDKEVVVDQVLTHKQKLAGALDATRLHSHE